MTITARITQLITGSDNLELVRDQIAAILVVESAQQQVLAENTDENPALWKLRVFLERSNPWEEFETADGQPASDRSPIVNISADLASFDQSTSNVVERQRCTATFNIDCYGYGISAKKSGGGHTPGDEASALEAQRAYRLVRRILMAGAYTYLGFTQQQFLTAGQKQVVLRRWPQSVNFVQPQIGDRPLAHVTAARFALQVDFNETSPQVEGQPLELLSLVLKKPGTNEVVLKADYSYV